MRTQFPRVAVVVVVYTARGRAYLDMYGGTVLITTGSLTSLEPSINYDVANIQDIAKRVPVQWAIGSLRLQGMGNEL